MTPVKWQDVSANRCLDYNKGAYPLRHKASKYTKMVRNFCKREYAPALDGVMGKVITQISIHVHCYKDYIGFKLKILTLQRKKRFMFAHFLLMTL